ncbi:MAG TPA: hypothetical protein VKZ49_14055 [Polyangiaceae bacterium]|nr:hypothetical protein [Polyangiaceae bacterium]
MLRRCGFALLASCGCTQVLGLDDQHYDRDPALEAPGASSAGSGSALNGAAGAAPGGGGAPSVPGTGGAGGAPPARSGKFPFALGPSRRIVATTPEASSFYVYDAATGALEAYRPSLGTHPRNDRYEITGSWSWSPGFDLVVEVATGGGGAALIGYRSDTGWVEYAPAPLPGEPLEPAPRSGTRNWTHLVPVRLEPTPALFSYDRKSGRYRLGPAEMGDPADQQLGRWEVAWSNVVGVSGIAADPASAGLLKFEPETGEAELDSVWLGEGAPAGLARGNFGLDWTSATAFAAKAGAGIVLYDANDGRVAIGALALTDSSMNLSVKETGVWRGWIEQIVPIRVDGAPVAVTSGGGVVDLMQLDPLESSDITVE